MQRTVLLLLLLLLLPLVAAERVCITGDGVAADYECLPESEYAGSDFSNYCYLQDGDMSTDADPKCVQVCCCYSDGNGAWADAPVSQQYCTDLSTGDFSVAQTQNDCDAACGAGPGSGGGTCSVSGTVTDTSTNQPVDAAMIQYPVGGTIATTYTDANGQYVLDDVACTALPDPFHASRRDCGEQLKESAITANTVLDFELDCTVGACAVPSVNTTRAAPRRGTDTVVVTWTPDSCLNTQGYLVQRCEAAGQTCTGATVTVGYAAPGTNRYEDTVEPATGYCYTVRALAPDGSEKADATANATQRCILPMDSYCMDDPAPGAQCFNTDTELNPIDTATGAPLNPFTGVARCDANNRVQVEDVCTVSEFCAPVPGSPQCMTTEYCERCNGLFGWFYDALAYVGIEIQLPCKDLDGCFLNNDGYAADTVESCKYVQDCYGYTTAAACAEDACTIDADGCQWQSPPGLAEFGRGVCAPQNLERADCTACDDLFGFCNAELCGLLGDCYYNERSTFLGDPLGCMGPEEAACRYFDTKQSCVGLADPSQDWRPEIDLRYDAPDTVPSVRTGGSNAIITPSQDRFDYGVCAWISVTDPTNPVAPGYCVKDANARLAAPAYLFGTVADDCLEIQGQPFADIHACYRDATPPTTTLPFNDTAWLTSDQLQAATPIVHDDTFLIDPATGTYAGLVLGADQPCEATVQWPYLLPDTVASGAYTLCYYSVDPAQNHERQKSMNIYVRYSDTARLRNATLAGG